MLRYFLTFFFQKNQVLIYYKFKLLLEFFKNLKNFLRFEFFFLSIISSTNILEFFELVYLI